MRVPVLECERVRLRPYRASDGDALFRVFGDPEVARYWSFPPWTERAQAEAYLAPLIAELPDAPTVLPWVIADRAHDELVGTTTIFAWHREQRRAEIGYSLQRAHWGQGIAREAVSRVLDHGFTELGLRRFEADIDPRNAASIALVERLGFRREGLLRERWLVGGEACDSVVYGLLARDWR
ncbi:MAG TPA: GNAT family protein [Kofleriaceae bacterium]|nr:GNAT family protein [Kofleriaceae bacterium]